LAEYLVNSYGIDADATWLLNYHEIHLMLQTNPDGRKKAETGLLWRKNTNQNYCGPDSNARGADLNRNFRFYWSCCGGSSGFQCAYTFHGPSPASEPETQSVQNYIYIHFKDQRGEKINDAAPLNASGLYLDIHSSGRLILWPWGFTSDPAPNATQLQTLGRKLAFFNGHTPIQSYGLYPTDGTTISFAYGEMGLAGFRCERIYSRVESNIQNASIVAWVIAKTVNCEPTTVNGYSFLCAGEMPAATGGFSVRSFFTSVRQANSIHTARLSGVTC